MRRLTERGFVVYDEFDDTYGNAIRIQESSNINRRCWVFCNPQTIDGMEVPVGVSAHLDIKQAERIIEALKTFIKESKDEE